MPLLGLLNHIDWNLGLAHLGGYHLFYALCGVVMVPCTAALLLFPKPAPAVNIQPPTPNSQCPSQDAG